MEEVARQRRFALSIGIVLFVFSLAGVEMNPNGTLNPLGIPLKILRPDWLLIGLVIASVYAIYRYCLHALFLAESPMQARALIWRAQKFAHEYKRSDLQTELGRNRLQLERAGGRDKVIEERMRSLEENLAAVEARRPSRWRWSMDVLLQAAGKEHAEKWESRFRAAYPTLFGVGPDPGPVNPPWYSFTVPRRSWYLANLIDFDYLLPILVNLAALGTATSRLCQ